MLKSLCKYIIDVVMEKFIKSIWDFIVNSLSNLIEVLIDRNIYHLPKGIVRRKELDKNRNFKNEVFGIEVLNNDIILKKVEDTVNMVVDRRNVKYALISNEGKRNLNDIVIRKGNKFDELKKLDKNIQYFLREKGNNETKLIGLKRDNLNLRWASGGILPIVEYKNKLWIAMLFRDKAPSGWNLFLGASERNLKNGKIQISLEQELNNPLNFIYREFEEEILILDKEPTANTENYILRLALPYYGSNDGENKFNKQHMKLRNDYDNLYFTNSNKFIKCDVINTNMSLSIINSNGEKLKPVTNLIFTINFLELGIETVQILKFKLNDDNVILDGEILKNRNNKKDELVRMPVALIAYDYLKSIFKEDISNFKYQDWPNPSMVLNSTIPKDEMVIFNYDIKRRVSLMKNSEISEHEVSRYRHSFEKFFDPDELTIKEEATKYFTPTTAKVLNLFFNWNLGKDIEKSFNNSKTTKLHN